MTLRCEFTVKKAWMTNLLEENESALDVRNDSIGINSKPYQIITVCVKGRAE